MSSPQKVASIPGQCLMGLVFLGLLIYQEDQVIRKVLELGRPHLEWRLWFPVTLLGLGLLIPNPRRWPALGLMGLATNLMLLADTVYGRFFGIPPSVLSSAALNQVGHTVSSILALLQLKDLLPLLLWSLFFFPSFPKHQVTKKSLVPAVLTLLVAAGLWGRARTRTYDGLTAAQQPGLAFSRAFTVRYMGLFTYHWMDLFQALTLPHRPQLEEPDRQALAAALGDRHSRNVPSDPLFGTAAGRNVILIQMEAWQHFLIGLEVDGVPVTPNLNRMAKSGLSFDHVMDFSCVGRTSDAEFAALTGLYPACGRISGMAYARNQLQGLPAFLGKQGYQTWSFHGFQAYFWNRAELHPALGIQHMQFQNKFPDQVLGWGVPDDVFFAQAAHQLAQAKPPFFSLLISLSCHHPFDALPNETRHFNLPNAPTAAGYLELAHFADRGLGLFLEGLQAAGLDQKSLILLYGDHDAGMDPASLAAMSQLTGKNLVSPAEDRVPFVILAPGLEAKWLALKPRAASTVGGLHDLFPTVCHLLGKEPPAGIWGVNLLASHRDNLVQPIATHRGYWLERQFHDLAAGKTEAENQALELMRLNRIMLDGDAQPLH